MTDRYNLDRVLEAARQRDVDLPPLSAWPGDPVALFAASGFLTHTFSGAPRALADLLEGDTLARPYPDAEAIVARVRETLNDVPDRDALMQRLRVLRNAEMARIAWRDLAGLASLPETLRDLSSFADAAIDGALTHLDGWQRTRRGVPRDAEGREQSLIVYGLGKLGAGELNFSSDVDLIFAYERDGETHGARRSISSHEYFLQLGRSLIDVLQTRTEHGFVYRVDMRLRPFGRAGALVMNFATMEDYYQRHGRDWERYALIRMRPVAGDIAAGERLLNRLQPFVFKRYMDFGTLESLREMKAMIAEEVNRRSLDDHLKLGPGGIREVEFTTQAFQLVRGGQDPRLRGRQVLEVLDTLAARSLLPEYAVVGLKAAYAFLRRSENLVQAFEDRQTHTLPDDATALTMLARCMGFDDAEGYLHALGEHRAHVREQFDQILGGDEVDQPLDATGAMLLSGSQDEGLEELLAELGFADASTAGEAVRSLRDSFERRSMDQRGEERLKRLLPDLLRAVAASPNAQQTLERVLAVTSKILRRSTYLALLAERPLAVSHLVKLCSASPWVTRQIADQPQLLDELLDARTLYRPPDRAALMADLTRRLSDVADGDMEQEMGALRQFKHRQVLRVAAADIAGVLPLMKVSDHLTDIAEVVVHHTLALARRDMDARHGAPLDGDGAPVPFTVVAYGKLGGIELGYGSDLDLVFLHGDVHGETPGPRQVDPRVYFARLAQRIVHYLATPTADGTLYEVDTRLRPHGKDGVIASSLSAFESYQRDEAWTWEHQALVRARCVAGDDPLASAFRAARRRILCATRDPVRLRDEVREMRQRMREQLGSRREGRFDLKQDPGGIADIEFIVQYQTLRNASDLGENLDFTDNIRLLNGLESSGALPARDAGVLSDAYRELRSQTHRLSLQEEPAVLAGESNVALREQVQSVWQGVMGADDDGAPA